MSGSDRNFRSARDRTEERQPPTKTRKHNAWSGIERRSSSHHAWADFEDNHSELPSREPLHGNRYGQRDDRIKLDGERSGFDRWGCENRSRSPSDSWDLPRRGKHMRRDRSRDRSQDQSRDWSRSQNRGGGQSRGRPRDRSRSPFKRFSYGTSDIRNGTGMSSQPCKYFAAGMCNKGSNCMFFHPDNHGFRDEKYLGDDLADRRRGRQEYGDAVEFGDNDKRHRNFDEKTKSWNGPTWDDVERTSDNVKSTGWGEGNDPTAAKSRRDDRRGRNFDEKTKSWNGPTWDDVKRTSDTAKSTGWGEGYDRMAAENRRDDRQRRNSIEKTKVWNGPTWEDVKDTSDAAKSAGWGDGSVGKTKLHDLTVAEKRGDGRRGRNLEEKTKLWNGPTWDDAKDISEIAKSIEWGDGSAGSIKLNNPIMFAEKQGDDRWGCNLDEKTKLWNGPTWDDVKATLDTVKASGWVDGSAAISTFHDLTAAEERGPHLENESRMRASPGWKDKAAERDERVSPHRDTQIIPESSQSQTQEIPVRVDEQNATEAIVMPTLVSENSYNIAITKDSNPPLNEVKVSDQNGKSTLQPLPTSTIIDQSHQGAHLTSSNGHNIDLNVPLQNMNTENEVEALPKEFLKPSTEILDIGAPREACQNVLSSKVGGTIDSKQEKESIIHGKVEESSNISKEEKAMRVFKIALVEFVKEILKPKWKEGQMSREVHKTIVKKTVDKVTTTIPVDQVPNTQEKIGQYLSFSEGKITKLVQAYVERFLKTADS